MSKKIAFLVVFCTIVLSGCSKQSPEEMMISAKANITKGDLSTAVVELKSIVSQDFTSVEGRTLLGQVYLKLSEFDAAEKELRRAIEMGAAAKDVYPFLAKTLYYQEDFQGVIDLSGRTGVGLDQQVQETVELLAYLAQVRLNQADAASVEVPNFENANNTTLAKAYLAYVTNAPQEADQLLSKIMSSDENKAEKLFLQGLVKNRLQQLKEAAQGYEQLLAIYPNYHLVRLLLIDILVRDNELSAANENIDLLLQVSPDQPTVNFYKGSVEFLEEDYEASFIHSQKAKDGNVSDFRNDIVHGLSALKLGNLEQAYGSLSRAATVLPKTHSVHRILAKIQLDLGYRTEAMQSLHSLEGENELDAILFENAATLFANERDFGAATQQMTMANRLSGQVSANQLLREGLVKIAANDYSGVKQIEQSIEMQPDVVQKWLLLADVYMDQDQSEKALSLAKQLAEQDEVSGLVLEGQILGRMEQPEQAIDLYQRALKLDKTNIAAANNLIKSYRATNQPEKARLAAYTALNQNPENKIAASELVLISKKTNFDQRDFTFLTELKKQHSKLETPKLILATWYREKGDNKAAIDILKENIKSLSSAGLMALGDTYYNEGMLSDAAPVYEQWKIANPQDIQPLLRLVAVYAQQNNPQKLRLFLDQSIAQFPNAEPLRLARVQNLIRTSSFSEAQREFNLLVSAGSTNVLLNKFKGQLALAGNQPEVAVDAFKAFYAFSKSMEDAINLSNAHLRNNQAQTAREVLAKYIEEVDSSPASMSIVAEFMLTQKFYKDAVDYYNSILQNQPKSLVAQNNLAMAYLGAEQFAEALEAAEKAADLAPTVPQIMDTYGWVLYKNGKTQEAQALLALAYEKLPNDPSVALHYAEILLSVNNLELAQRVLSSITANSKTQQTQLATLKAKVNKG
jgi:putative PEP-CTERM system TPR-repeat lipoprotein